MKKEEFNISSKEAVSLLQSFDEDSVMEICKLLDKDYKPTNVFDYFNRKKVISRLRYFLNLQSEDLSNMVTDLQDFLTYSPIEESEEGCSSRLEKKAEVDMTLMLLALSQNEDFVMEKEMEKPFFLSKNLRDVFSDDLVME